MKFDFHMFILLLQNLNRIYVKTFCDTVVAENQRLVNVTTLLLALLKYPFYYMIRSGFGKFFGIIHVLTRHLAPELDRFRFCPGFWSMLYFGGNWTFSEMFRRDP